ncbi:carboxylate-amine ligase [Desulfolutivibrio sulfoxidireducens]|uniref:carboxylate-amine ligase n=1 Tax=Desulfolutivibrio sulfoxidireducens TaxID=2773299 RepID=UPI00210A4364|nr:glutamate-cysteine ligase family protein [Desulfolutivibrio sulfoxidireducens]
MSGGPFHLFQVAGLEIEYMIVDAATLRVLPRADLVLRDASGAVVSDMEHPDISWSNELVSHVIELKTSGPTSRLAGTAGAFQDHVRRINALLAPHRARLLPTGAHPFMDPGRETVLWPHEYGPVYAAFDRIFGCRGHGWSNLQSMHVNLPFHGDEEFGRLHAAIRLLLPIMPALAASTPVLDGRITGCLDSRMSFYGKNSARVPSVAGRIVPEPVFDEATYRRDILGPMYRDMAPLDPEGVLRDEFLNARGAIARFDRGAIEIRVLDTQECPAADVAVAGLVRAALMALAEGRLGDMERFRAMDTARLASILASVIRDADAARIEDADYLAALGISGRPRPAGEIWKELCERCLPLPDHDPAWDAPLASILERGCLSRRILAALGGDVSRDRLMSVYRRLADCLEAGEVFHE